MKRVIFFLAIFIISQSTFSQQYIFDVLVSGMRMPTVFALLPNNNVIVNQQQDSTKIYNISNGQLISCFWNFNDSVYYNGETGLMGICLDPNFNSNHYVYIVYTDRNDSCIRIVRLTENNNQGTNPLIVSKFKRQGASQYGGPHMAGNIRFGPLNKLYITIGEPTVNNSQSLSSPLGKIHRINADGTIPTDNPFYDDGNPLTGNDDRIWAYGMRNSWDFTFSPINDSIYATENNGALHDEFNFIRKGKNYGWPICQGFCNPYNPLYKDPMDTLPNSPGNIHFIPTGILIYNGSVIPELYGKLLIAGAGGLIKYNLGNAPSYDTVIPPYSRIINPNNGIYTTILQGSDGFIYLAKFHNTNGLILRMGPDPNGINNNGEPVSFSLSQNYPNPFNPITTIKYSLLQQSYITLKIFDPLGREIETLVNEDKQAGNYEINWDASNYPSGVYFYRLITDDFSEEKKMVLIK